MNTFTKFGNVFYNEWLCPEDSLEFWNSIIFYNYVQYSTEQARVSPKDKEFTNSENAFFAVLEKYNPDIIIAWGKRLWKNLPSNGFYKTLDDEETSINDGKGLYYYRIGNKDIPIFYVYHPSSSHFTYDSHSVLKEAFDKIAETK